MRGSPAAGVLVAGVLLLGVDAGAYRPVPAPARGEPTGGPGGRAAAGRPAD